MEKIAAEKLKTAADAIVLLFAELQILEDIEVEVDEALGFVARVGKFSMGESLRDGEQAIGDALHRGDYDDDAGVFRSLADQAGGVQHSFGTEQRAAAKLECNDILVSACLGGARGNDEAPR